MFTTINRIFRKKNKTKINNLKITEQDKNILQTAGLDINKIKRDRDQNFIITNEKDKLKV